MHQWLSPQMAHLLASPSKLFFPCPSFLKVGLHLNFAEKFVFSFSLKSATLALQIWVRVTMATSTAFFDFCGRLQVFSASFPVETRM